jgi:TetR/AcrR family transcriptional repressor of nem operon
MRYHAEHKSATRRRILDAASQAFRERGVAATGVDEVMRRAGLTHGGFYAHFRDKSQLVAEASAAGFDSAVPNLSRIAALPTRSARVRALVLSYLGPRHRDNPAGGCLVATLGAEASRLAGPARAGFSAAFMRHRQRFADALRLADEPGENLRLVTSLMSLLVGAMVFARAVNDSAISDVILSDARRTALALFATSAKSTSSPVATETA